MPSDVRRLRVFAARAQPETKARFVENDGEDDEDQNADIRCKIDLVQERLAEEADIRAAVKAERRFLDHKPARAVAGEHLQRVLVGDDADEEQHQRGSEHVQRRAADGLVGLEVDRRKRQQQREHRAERRRNEHRQEHVALQRHPVARGLGRVKAAGGLQNAHEQHADERAEDHNAFQARG